MFPKPAGTHRGNQGTLAGSIGGVFERSDGNVYLTPSLSITNPDPADSQEYEYWNGTSWVSDSFFNINNAAYVVGYKWRTRIVNSYFDSVGPWVESPEGTLEDTGGYTTISMPSFTVFNFASPVETTGNTLFFITVNNIPVDSYDRDRNIWSQRQVFASVSWQQSGSPSQQTAQFTFDYWPDMFAGFSQSQGAGQMAITNVSGGLATMTLYIPATIDGNWTSTVQTYVEFRALYPDGANYGVKGDFFP